MNALAPPARPAPPAAPSSPAAAAPTRPPSPDDAPLAPEEPQYPTLPPIGMIGPDDHGTVVSYLQGLAQEAVEDGRDQWAEVADTSMTIYTYGASPAPDGSTVVVNEIQNAVIAVTDIQTKEPPAVSLEPVERGEPPICFWAGPPEIGLALGLQPFQVEGWADEMGQQQPPLPLEELQADTVRDAIMAGGIPIAQPQPQLATGPDGKPAMDANGQPVMAPPPMQRVKDSWLVEVNDQLVADVYQGVFDVLWARSETDRRIRSNLLTTNIQGWTFWLYGFDDEEHRHKFEQLSIRQAYVDPTVESVADAAYAMVDLVGDAAQEKRENPDLADVIDRWAQTGQPRRIDGTMDLGDAFDRAFRRGMLTKRIAWLRNQPCPYTVEQAIQDGLVEQVEVPDALAGVGTDDVGGDRPGELEGGADLLDPLEGDVVPGAEAPAVDDAGGGGVAVVPVQPRTRLAIFLAGTDQEVSPPDYDARVPASPDWPTYNCIRQLTVIGDVVVQDKQCEFWSIPLCHNCCIPIPHRPWGIGEPFRLANLQAADSDVMDAMVEYVKMFRAPVHVMSNSMWEATQAVYAANAYLKPGKVIIVPDLEWQQSGGKIDAVVNPPGMPEGLQQLGPMLRQRITELSGNADVLQGRAQAQIKSGKAIELLQSSAASMIGFKSQRTGDMVSDLGHHMLHSIITRMEVEDVERIVSKYPRHVLAAIVERAKAAEWDVAVTVSSGNGAVLAQKKQQALQDLSVKGISMETYRDIAGIDDRQEKGRLAKEQLEMARGLPGAGGAGVMPGMAAPEPNPQQVPGGGPPTRGEG